MYRVFVFWNGVLLFRVLFPATRLLVYYKNQSKRNVRLKLLIKKAETHQVNNALTVILEEYVYL